MRQSAMRATVFLIPLVAAGVLWLLFNLDWIPSFDWLLTLILVGSGIALLMLEGINKKSIVGGPLLIALGLTWLLHFYIGVRWRYLGPGLCIVAGTLMLIARSSAIPEMTAGRTNASDTNPD